MQYETRVNEEKTLDGAEIRPIRVLELNLISDVVSILSQSFKTLTSQTKTKAITGNFETSLIFFPRFNPRIIVDKC